MKFRIQHFPQVPCKPFIVECGTYEQAKRISDALCDYDLFLLKYRHRVDYANASVIQCFDEQEQEWFDYDPDEWEQEG